MLIETQDREALFKLVADLAEKGAKINLNIQPETFVWDAEIIAELKTGEVWTIDKMEK